ncbi:MAG: hypothetical protein AB1782_13670 [Cyanobacteriota bacterium]
MDKNPFQTKIQAPLNDNKKTRINLFSSSNDFLKANQEPSKQLSRTEKSILAVKLLKNKMHQFTDDTLKKISNPILSETQKASTFIMAEKKSLFGESDSNIYQLLNLLSSKKTSVALRASSMLEQKLINPEHREIIYNYFKYNPTAKEQFSHLHKMLLQFSTD